MHWSLLLLKCLFHVINNHIQISRAECVYLLHSVHIEHNAIDIKTLFTKFTISAVLNWLQLKSRPSLVVVLHDKNIKRDLWPVLELFYVIHI